MRDDRPSQLAVADVTSAAIMDPAGTSGATEWAMRAKPTLLTAVLVLMFSLGGSAGAPAQRDEAYPIWWSPSLGLDSLDQIDALLNKDFTEIQWKVFASRDTSNTRKMIVDDCASYLLATKNNYYKSNFRNLQEADEYARLKITCEVLEFLKKARPAARSHLRDFVFSAGILDFLPEMVRQNFHHQRTCEIRRANKKGIPWSQFEDFPLVDVASTTKVVVLGSHRGVRLEVMARGDFDGDALDDILIKSSLLPLPNGYVGYIRLFVLTRFTADGVLRILNPPHIWSPCDLD